MRKATLIATLVIALLATAAIARADLPSGSTLVATVAVPAPGHVESGFGSIWVANGPSRTVTRTRPPTRYSPSSPSPIPPPCSQQERARSG